MPNQVTCPRLSVPAANDFFAAASNKHMQLVLLPEVGSKNGGGVCDQWGITDKMPAADMGMKLFHSKTCHLLIGSRDL